MLNLSLVWKGTGSFLVLGVQWDENCERYLGGSHEGGEFFTHESERRKMQLHVED